MKKTILMLMLFALVGIVQAQTVYTFAVGATAKGDTVQHNTAITKTMTLTKNFTAGSIQVVNAKLSGTVGGTTILQVSVDGTNFKTVNAVGDTLTNTNTATNSKIWDLNPVKYKYYRIVTTGSGSDMIMTTRAYAYLRKEE
jgi:hypothetical protein